MSDLTPLVTPLVLVRLCDLDCQDHSSVGKMSGFQTISHT